MRKIIIISCLFLTSQAFGMIDIRSNTSVTSGKVTADFIKSSKPTLLNYTEDLYVLYNELPFVSSLQLGFGGSFRFVRQMSTVNADVGNYKGNRWELYPVIGYTYDKFWAGIAPVYNLGRYNMSKTTPDKKEVYYFDPLGLKLFASRDFGKIMDQVDWGVAFSGDYITYPSYNLATEKGVEKDYELKTKLKIWSVGFAINLKYGV